MHDPENDFRSWSDPEADLIEGGFRTLDYVLLLLVAVCSVAMFLIEYYGSAAP